jgi:di/tricarboxylate transporter
MISFDGIVTGIVILFILISLYKELFGPALTFMIGIITLGILQVLSPNEILNGFSNQQIVVIIMLLLIGNIIRNSGVLDSIFYQIFKKTRSQKKYLFKISLIVGSLSAFLNNTPLVALMMPYTHNWSKLHNIRISKLLIPLSYIAILGGCVTLIGTSTNLVVSGMVVEQQITDKLQTLNIFDFTIVGLPMLILGSIYLMLFSNKLLPDKKDVSTKIDNTERQYMVETSIRKNSTYIGKTIKEAGLRDLEGLYLVKVIRDNYDMPAVSPSTVLNQDDILVFAGDTQTIANLINPKSGLNLLEVGMFSKRKQTEVLEVVISHNSTLINKTVKESGFRGKYDAAIIGIHRNGEKISGKIGLVTLKAGDVLLLITGEDFYKRTQDSQDFYIISKIRDFSKLSWYKTAILTGGTIIAILLAALKITTLFISLLTLLLIILILKITSPKDIHKSIDYNLAIIIAMALALGTAMDKTGLAKTIADFTINVFRPFGLVGLMAGLYLITAFLSAYITNIAAVAIIFPISVNVALDMGLNPTPFVLLMTFAAAASFITPIGYQTNLMVYGPGGYSFKDYFKIGFPLTMMYMVVSIGVLGFYYGLF